ncbi:MAG TPA: MBL fold metallo-hydrolase [Candidatus Lokiarchaeia archaeon]|nr:MBL fold metallo-hydrolase [Candidatus Lokiarchaeia archaeon]
MKIADDIFAYIHPFGANCAVFAFKDGNDVDLLDTGIVRQFALRLVLKGMGRDGIDPRRVRHIVHTHGHFDHVQADGYFQKRAAFAHPTVPVFAPQADLFRLAPGFNTIHWNMAHLLQRFPGQTFPRFRRAFHEMNFVFSTICGYKPPANLQGYVTGDELTLGRYRATATCTGGHTEGHAILWAPEGPFLVTGDNDAINEATCTFQGILESHQVCREIYARHSSDDLLLLRGHNEVLKGEKGQEWNEKWFTDFGAISSSLLPYFQRLYERGQLVVDIGRIIRLFTGYLSKIRVVELFAFMRVFVILKYLQEQGFGHMRYEKNSLWFEISPDARDRTLEF